MVLGVKSKTMTGDRLGSNPFEFRDTKSGTVQIFYLGKIITTLSWSSAAKFLYKVLLLDERGQQLVMAKTTGHFKHGNERLQKKRST